MEQTVVRLGDHVAAIDAHTAHRSRSPNGVAGEEVVILGSTQEAHDAQLHDHLVDELLSLLLGEGTVLEVTLDVDVEEGADTSDGHGGTILILDGTQIAEVRPLDSLACVLCRTCHIETISGTHALELLECIDLVGNLLAAAYDFLGEFLDVDTLVEALLLLDEVGGSVECDTAVVADDASTSVSIGQTRDDVCVTSGLDVIVVGSKDTFVVRLAVLGVDGLGPGVQFIAVSLESRLHHADTTLGEDTALERLVGLHTHNHLVLLADISRAVSVDALGQAGLSVIDTLLALHLEHLAQNVPQLGGLG